MADVAYKISGINSEKIAQEIRTLRENSSTFRELEARAAAAGYDTIEMGALPGNPALGASHSPQGSPNVWHIDLASHKTGTWGSVDRQVYIGEIIAHELAHANVPPEHVVLPSRCEAAQLLVLARVLDESQRFHTFRLRSRVSSLTLIHSTQNSGKRRWTRETKRSQRATSAVLPYVILSHT